MLNPTALAHAVTTVVAVVYVICRVLASIAPDFLFSLGQSWFHAIKIQPDQLGVSMSLNTFIFGLVSLVILTWVTVYATAMLYNRWTKT